MDGAIATGRRTRLGVPAALGEPPAGRVFTADAMARPIRVLFVVALPRMTPAVSVHLDLMRFFDPARVEVHAVYPRSAARDPDPSAGTSVLDALARAPRARLRPFEFGPAFVRSLPDALATAARAAPIAVADLARLVRFVRAQRIDVVHCEYGVTSAILGHVLARLTPARSLVHLHAPWGDWLKPPSAYAMARADAIVPVAEWVGRGVRDAGVLPERILPVLNGIDVDRFDPSLDGSPVRAELGIGRDDPVIVQVAQLDDWKRQHLTIDAFARVVTRHPRARLLLVGAEQDPAGPYEQRLRRQIEELGLAGSVTLTGRRGDVDRVLAAADVFCLPSPGDPCALAHIEAMAMATPVVTVAAGGGAELIVDGETGLHAAVDDPDSLAAALIALIEDPQRRARLGAAGRRRAVEYLNAGRMADDVEAVYRHLAGQPSEPAPG
jgi:glycosyltransferase involved in cell wall biosynthesis